MLMSRKGRVFLCHNSREKDGIKQISLALLSSGAIRTWLDTWEIPGGDTWEQYIRRGFVSSSSCLVFVGASGFGPFQREEISWAKERQAIDPDYRVIPVLLPGVDQDQIGELDNLLPKVHWVDLTNGYDSDESLFPLLQAVQGDRPGPPVQALTVAVSAERWDQTGRTDRSLLIRGHLLREAQALADKSASFDDLSLLFLTASSRAQQRRTRIGMAVLVCAAIVLAGISLYANAKRHDAVRAADNERQAKELERNARQDAETQRDNAQKQEETAKERLAGSQASEGDALASAGKWQDARRRYAESYETYTKLGLYPATALHGLWDADRFSPLPIAALHAHQDAVLAAAFFHASARALTGGRDGKLLLWDLGTETPRVLDIGKYWIRIIAISPDDHFAVTTGSGRTLNIWDLRGDRAIGTLDLPEIAERVRFFPNNDRVLISDQSGQLAIWSLLQQKRLMLFQKKHAGRAPDVALTPDGTHAVSVGFDRQLKYWDTASGTLLRSYEFGSLPLLSVAFHPQDDWAIVGGMDGSVRVVNIDTGLEVHPPSRHDGPVRAIVATSDGDRIITSSDDQTIRIWDVTGGGEMARLVAHRGPIFSLDLSRDEKVLLSASHDKSTMLWNLAPQEVRSLSNVSNLVQTVALAPNGFVAATGDKSGKIILRETKTGQSLSSFDIHSGAALSLAIDQTSTTLAVGGEDGRVTRWNMANLRFEPTLKVGQGPVRFISFASHGDLLLTVAGSVDVWHSTTSERISRCAADRPLSASFSSDGQSVLVVDSAKRLVKCDLRSGLLLGKSQPQKEPDTLVVSGDSRLALSGNKQGMVTVWNAKSLAPIAYLSGHKAQIIALAFCPDFRCAISLSEDHEMKLWDLDSYRELRQFRPLAGYSYFGFRDAVIAAAISLDCARILTGGPHRTLQLWDLGRGPLTLSWHQKLEEDRRPNLGAWFAFQGLWDWVDKDGKASLLDRAYASEEDGDDSRARTLYRRAVNAGEAPCWYVRLLSPSAGLQCN
jgi:WD40 repeat protein